MINLGSTIWETINSYKIYLKGESYKMDFPNKQIKQLPDETPTSNDEIYYQGSIFNVWEQFDKSFIVCLFLCNFSQGFKQFLDLSLLNLFKNTLKLDVGEVQIFMGLISVPWSFKIVYGFMSDNISVLNSKRRGHVLLNAACCITSMASIIIFGSQFGKYFVTFCCFVSQINMAYNDTVTDAMTVMATKKGF